MTAAVGGVMGGIEVALVVALKVSSTIFNLCLPTSVLTTSQNAESRSRNWAFILLGVLSAVLLCAGVLRHYWDIYIHCTVRGISFIFVGIDALGDIFSLASVCK